MTHESVQSVCGLTVLLVLLVGCGGEGGDIVGDVLPDPEPIIISGEWDTDTTELLDTCGFDPFPSYAPLLVEESGDTVIFTFNDGYGNCQESVRNRSGDTVTLTKIDTVVAGCGLVRVQSSYVYDFTETTLSGTTTHQYSMLDGNCSNVPCTYQLAVGGTRCARCWPGCVNTSFADAEPLVVDGSVPGALAIGQR